MRAEGFSPLRFSIYAADLARAILELSKEKVNRMSIEEIKQRLASVPGIENLTMRLEGGKEVYSVGGPFVAVDPMATAAEIDAAIRSVAPVIAAPIAATPLPAVTLAPVASVPSSIPPTPAAAHLSVKDMMAQHMATMAEIQRAQMALLEQSLARQVQSVSNAVGSVVGKIDAQTDDFLAQMGAFSNALGGENG